MSEAWSKREWTDEEFESVKSGEILVEQCFRGWRFVTEEEKRAKWQRALEVFQEDPLQVSGPHGLDDFEFMWVARKVAELDALTTERDELRAALRDLRAWMMTPGSVEQWAALRARIDALLQ